MNGRRLLAVGVAVGATCLLIVLLNQNLPSPILQSSAIGAEPKVQKPSILVQEFGTKRLVDVADQFSISVSAYRKMKSGDATAFYGVNVDDKLFKTTLILPIETAQELIGFYEKYKTSQKSNAAEIAMADVIWAGTDDSGTTVVFTRSLGEKEFIFNSKQVVGSAFFSVIKTAIEDCKALKAIPFSVKP